MLFDEITPTRKVDEMTRPSTSTTISVRRLTKSRALMLISIMILMSCGSEASEIGKGVTDLIEALTTGTNGESVMANTADNTAPTLVEISLMTDPSFPSTSSAGGKDITVPLPKSQYGQPSTVRAGGSDPEGLQNIYIVKTWNGSTCDNGDGTATSSGPLSSNAPWVQFPATQRSGELVTTGRNVAANVTMVAPSANCTETTSFVAYAVNFKGTTVHSPRLTIEGHATR
jgi:hypothetical protein